MVNLEFKLIIYSETLNQRSVNVGNLNRLLVATEHWFEFVILTCAMRVLFQVIFFTFSATSLGDIVLCSALGKGLIQNLPVEELPLLVPPIEDVAEGMIMLSL